VGLFYASALHAGEFPITSSLVVSRIGLRMDITAWAYSQQVSSSRCSSALVGIVKRLRFYYFVSPRAIV